MLSYIVHTLSHAFPHGISSSLPSLPPNRTTRNEIVRRFRYSKDIILHLLRSPGYFDITAMSFVTLCDIILDNDIPISRCEQISNDIITNLKFLISDDEANQEPLYKVLYETYRLTENDKYSDIIISNFRTHLVGYPIKSVTLGRIIICLVHSQADEIRFLMKYLSPEDMATLVSRHPLYIFIHSTRLLIAMLPCYTNDPNYRIAYAMAYRKLLDTEAKEISPVEYFISRKYRTAIDIPVNTNMFGLDVTLTKRATKSDLKILEDMAVLININSDAFTLVLNHINRINKV